MPRKQRVTVDDREFELSNLEKVYFPDTGFTKGEVLAYYSSVADVILPHLRDRPLTLKRYPDGVTDEHFYEKNAPSHTPDWVERFAVPRSEGGSDIRYVLANDRATLLWATNLGDIEKHVILARAPDIHVPTSVVFDLDPGEPATILDCARVAIHLREMFSAWGLEIFVKASGSKGLHVAVPLNTPVTYELTQPFAKAIAELARQQLPKLVVSDMAKTLRRGKVLIDWSQNSDFKTTVAVYAMRAKHGEPFISMPVTWEELEKAIKRKKADGLCFTPKAALKRLEKAGDLFEPVLTLAQKLPAEFTTAMKAGPPPRLATWPKPRDKSLREYAAKRDPARTPEPYTDAPEKDGSEKNARRFVIQKHAASHLHYDFRLQMQGVLRSWAVPKGPPTKLKDARLAMHVEDHPLDYATFEGTIPPGNYGAGTVMVWDQGEYEDLTGNPAKAYHSGKMHLIMRGKKLRGEWILVKDRRDDAGNKWLLIKAGEDLKPISAKVDDTSVLSGRSMRQIAKDNDAQWQSNRPAARAKSKFAAKIAAIAASAPPDESEADAKPSPAKKGARKSAAKPSAKPRTAAGKASRAKSRAKKPPSYIEPMQCKPVPALPAGGEWTFEIKFDGYRCIAVKDGSRARLLSRNEKPLHTRFPQVAEALTEIEGDFVIDGEIVALDAKGRPSFQLLQNQQSRSVPVFYYIFDVLHRDGTSLLDVPLEERRAMLNELFPTPADPLRLSPLLEASPGHVIEAVGQLGLEGVVGKRLGSVYEPGERSGAWIKHRADRQQEFVIGGYIPGGGKFDALLVGVYEGKDLRFVAKVKNGFVPRLRAEIFPQLKKLQTPACPFSNLPEERSSRWGDALTAEKMKECRWVKPKLVCQVGFVEWTEAAHLRHCTFLGMRDDKSAGEVARET